MQEIKVVTITRLLGKGLCSGLGLPLDQLPVRPNPSLPTYSAEKYTHRARPDHRYLVGYDCFSSVLAKNVPDEHALPLSTLLVGLTFNLSGFRGVFMVPERSRLYPPCLAEGVIQVGGHVRVPTTHVEPGNLYVRLAWSAQ